MINHKLLKKAKRLKPLPPTFVFDELRDNYLGEYWADWTEVDTKSKKYLGFVKELREMKPIVSRDISYVDRKIRDLLDRNQTPSVLEDEEVHDLLIKQMERHRVFDQPHAFNIGDIVMVTKDNTIGLVTKHEDEESYAIASLLGFKPPRKYAWFDYNELQLVRSWDYGLK